jgi:hypothetical protein
MFEASVPDYFRDLFAIEKKSELERYCKDLVIRGDELVRLILYSSLIGYIHSRRHEEFQPDQAQLTDADLDILRRQRTDMLPKFAAKVRNLFATRKYLSAHLFYNDAKWHLFYFTFRDMEDEDPNHWKHGSHVHFVNYLWPDYRPEQLEELLFSDRHAKINSIHIQYTDAPSKPAG